jgi:hypothetical protein
LKRPPCLPAITPHIESALVDEPTVCIVSPYSAQRAPS